MKSTLLLVYLLSYLPLVYCYGQQSPNVIVIYADDLGYGDLSSYGATKLQTPNLDRLAKEGRKFTDAHTASPVCSPSRYCLLTGKYAFRENRYAPVFLRAGLMIDENQTTVADVFQRAGYATACIGKWHLGFGEDTPDWNGDLKPGPLELGFDYYFGIPVVNSHPPFVYVENHQVLGLVPEDPLVYGKRANTEEYLEKLNLDDIGGAEAAHALYKDREIGTKFTEKSVDWIKNHKDEPFFLYLATTNIHHPFTPAERFIGTSDCGIYGDFVHELDWMVGEVVKTLEEEGLTDNTLIIFTSDNGGMFNNSGQESWKQGHRMNGELLGFKFGAWEGGHRVPFIAKWPGHIPTGSVSDQLISNLDLLATVAALVQVPLSEDEGPDSFNVLPALVGSPDEPIRDHLILAPMKKENLALRQGKWMYIGAQGSGGYDNKRDTEYVRGGPGAHLLTKQVNSDIENGQFKPEAPAAQLYDLETDLSQATNVYYQYPDRVAEMNAQLEHYKNLERTAPLPELKTQPESNNND
ncbi:MAG: arylsulfatase [Bacteroidota bacterium]